MKPSLVILAAGMGSRYGSLKQIDAIGPSGEAIIDYSIYDAIRAGFEKVTFIIRKNIEQDFREVFGEKLKGKIETEYAFQELDMVPEGISFPPDRVKPWGTGHAVWVVKDYVREPFAVINADDFYGAGSYRAMADYLSRQDGTAGANYCMMGYQIEQTLSDFGSVSRGICESDGEDFLISVVERTDIVKAEGRIYFKDDKMGPLSLRGDELVSMNIWGFTPSVFEYLEHAFSDFFRKNSGKLKAELYIPSVVNDMVAGHKANVKILPAKDQWFGVTYKEDKQIAIENINKLIKKGIYPENLWA